MKNNTYRESKVQRLKRFQTGSPLEVIDTLTNSIDNFFNNEIRVTIRNKNYQTTLLFLGIHGVALTIAEGLLGERDPEKGYKRFLELFVDGDTEDTKFSTIYKQIHNWRNVLAHQWLGSIGHTIGYDYEMEHGWEVRDDITVINPRIYCEQYLKAFSAGGKIWNYSDYLTPERMEIAKERLIGKYKQR